jgi:predicted unusual protein kinase regulating ubiquinone biosynthesis (AarF/ABC1/UbiB family)
MNNFPSGKLERTGILAKTGLKIGGNYAKYHLKKAFGDKSQNKEDVHRESAQQLFKELTNLRGTALKLAQSISMDQSGLLPDTYVEIMTGAQYKVPPINRAMVRSIIKQELGGWPENRFSTFNADAVAAASIGQVHQATTLGGDDIAVKIQYPNVRETIKSDLKVAKIVFERFIESDNVDAYFDEVYSKLMDETDYLQEGKSIDHFAGRFNTDRYATPKWLPELSSGKVLSMSWLSGQHLDQFLAINPSQDQRNHFGQLLWDFFHDQIDSDCTIHADTHPGNFLFLPDGRLGIIDFGCVKKFPEPFFNAYISALPLHLENDTDKLMRLYEDLELYDPRERDTKQQDEYIGFVRDFGQTFAEPYRDDSFDFGNPAFTEAIRNHIQRASKLSGPRGSRHFIFASRVQVGLYTMLSRMRAEVRVDHSRNIIDTYLRQAMT